MNKIKLIFTILIIALATSLAVGQDEFTKTDAPRNRTDKIKEILGLTPEQVMRIRKSNRQSRLKMRNAQTRFREAKDELDNLIYSDSIDEETLQVKLREVVQAQGEITRIRARSELAVRSVLTPEQLVKFRELRKRRKQNLKRRQKQRQRRQRQRNLNRKQRNRPVQNKRLRQPKRL